jgi:hypothetical protein
MSGVSTQLVTDQASQLAVGIGVDVLFSDLATHDSRTRAVVKTRLAMKVPVLLALLASASGGTYCCLLPPES